jgi:carbamoyltransferase
VTTVLGISALYHDAAAALISDGQIVAAAQEERFSRKKHDPSFPRAAINYCLEEAFVDPSELDAVVFYDNPLLTWDRVLVSCLAMGTAGRGQFDQAARSILGSKIWVRDMVVQEIGSLGRVGKLLFTEHHMAHAASAFYPSPFRKAAIITVDGVGEWATTTIGIGEDNQIELMLEIRYPHSLGLLYSAFTSYCGFRVNDGEYKLMGLAPYGRPVYYDTILDHLIDVKTDGSYRLDTDYFGYLDSNVMTNERFHRLFGGPPRLPDSPITRREMDLAASVQMVLEDVMLKLARYAQRESGVEHLVLAGGVALNCVANSKIREAGIFKELWIQPAAGDAGGALGAALLVAHQYFDVPRTRRADARDQQRGSYLGPSYTPTEIAAYLDRHAYPYTHISDSLQRAQIVAKALADGKIVGYFSGRMEFGPRALGTRSILGDPRQPDMQSRMNLSVKYRESFRPFAPSVLIGDVEDFFTFRGESPYMLLVAQVQKARCTPHLEQGHQDNDDLLSLINKSRSDIPAVTHVDYSARLQTVHKTDNPDYHLLISQFKALTSYGVLVNTSFNVSDEPIVCTPQDAYSCFMQTELDLLVLGEYLLWKDQQPPWQHMDSRHTKPRQQSSHLQTPGQFFDEYLMPIIQQAEQRGALLSQRIDPDCPSYYQRRSRGLMDRVEFELPACSDGGSLLDAFGQIWTTLERTPFLDLAEPMVNLAESLYCLQEQHEEVLPFVYTIW